VRLHRPNRRRFLQTAIVVGAALPSTLLAATKKKKAAPPPSLPKPPLVGTQLYGWGQYYDREGKKLFDHLDEALSAIRDCGYHYAEGWLDVGTPENNGKFADKLRAKGLKPVSLYTGGAFHVLGKASETAERILASAKEARKAGFKIVVCNPDPIGREKTDAELKIQAEALVELGQELRKQGMQLGLHHHTPEMKSGGREFHYNFQHSPAETVGFCYDVHWVYRGGIQPADALRDYSGRIVSWHLRQSREQIWWEDLDTGDIDYSAVARFARQHKLPGFYAVELALEPGTKITRSVVENHRRSREFVRRVFSV
jgi:inosose dehydratase